MGEMCKFKDEIKTLVEAGYSITIEKSTSEARFDIKAVNGVKSTGITVVPEKDGIDEFFDKKLPEIMSFFRRSLQIT